MHVVVADTSPIQYLHQAAVLALLPELFGQIYIPQAVADEIETGRRHNISLPRIDMPWLKIQQVWPDYVSPLLTRLGNGEKEVLALGLEFSGALLLLDDKEARRQACQLSLAVTGTLGILLLAKEREKIAAIRPVLDQLNVLGFRLDPEVTPIFWTGVK